MYLIGWYTYGAKCLMSSWCEMIPDCLSPYMTLKNINVDKYLVVNYVKKAVLIDDFLGDDRDVYLHILGVK